jgi:hypothetical protein
MVGRTGEANNRGMLSREQIATIQFEIEKLRQDLDNCTDSGLKKVIRSMIEQQKQKLESERDSK